MCDPPLKKCLQRKHVHLPYHIQNKKWPEFAVKNVYKYVKTNTTILKYLPHEQLDQERWVDTHFFWGVCFAVLPQWSNEFYRRVVKSYDTPSLT